MKKINSILAIAVFVVIVSGCAKQSPVSATKSNAVLNTPVVNVGVRNVSTPSTDVKQVSCDNPVVMEIMDRKPLIEKAEFPQGEFRMSEMHLFVVNESNGNSYAASMKEADQFSVKLECNGLAVPEANSTSKTTGNFNATDVIDVSAAEKSNQKRTMELSFEDGALVLAISNLRPATVNSTQLDHIPLERTLIGNDTYITLRIYAITPNVIDFRVKLEFAADQDGKRLINFARVVYLKAE